MQTQFQRPMGVPLSDIERKLIDQMQERIAAALAQRGEQAKARIVAAFRAQVAGDGAA